MEISKLRLAILATAILIAVTVVVTQRAPDIEGPVSGAPRVDEIPEELATNFQGGLVIRPQPAYSGNELYIDGIQQLVRADLGSASLQEDMLRTSWFVNDQAAGQGPSLSPHHFEARDRITVHVDLLDTSGSVRRLGTASASIRNTPPEIKGILLRRDRSAPQTLAAEVSAVDVDGDPLSLDYQWALDGEVLGSGMGGRLDLGTFARGQSLTVTVTADDGETRSTPQTSRPFVMDNLPPRFTVGSAQVTAGPDGGPVLHCPLQLEDPDGDRVEVELAGAPEGVSWDPQTQAVLGPLPPGTDEVRFTVRATDGHGARFEQEIRLRF